MMNFEGRSIYFVGDSITANGGFLKALREHFKAKGRTVFLHNKGVPGYTASAVHLLLEEEFADFLPDYAVISFGVNDAGAWLYDSRLPLTDELLARREGRKQAYEKGIVALISYLRERGIVPILCSPFCVNENIEEKARIETVTDNREKHAIDSGLYTKKTMHDLNGALQTLRDFGCSFAEENGVVFWDMYTQTKDMTDGECFNEDGIHYTEKGNRCLAALFLRYMYGETLAFCEDFHEMDDIADEEFDERAYYFVKYNIMRDRFATLDDESLVEAVRQWIEKNGQGYGLTESRQNGFFRYVNGHREKQRRLIERIRSAQSR
jgi:lysophospholipase L1-like esterase